MEFYCNHLDLNKTFDCGQCFRWEKSPDNTFTGVVAGHFVLADFKDNTLFLDTSLQNEAFWRNYFDLDTDYDAVSSFSAGDYLDECAAYGRGIRILKQEPWEALCSFIISQCNNIPRIKKIINSLCVNFGEEGEYKGNIFSTFPNPERLVDLAPEDLSPLRCGYRAEYIINAAKAVCDGRLDLESLKKTSFDNCVKELCTIKGVGKKVANCAALFGLGHTEGFPIDTWIKKALNNHFDPDFNPASLGQYAGLAQQYLFYKERYDN